jgi:post-segregation antitoxin (ccd killing protein)
MNKVYTLTLDKELIEKAREGIKTNIQYRNFSHFVEVAIYNELKRNNSNE